MTMSEKEGSRDVVQKVEKSHHTVLKLYDSWVRKRQSRPALEIPEAKTPHDLKEFGLKNFMSQHVAPRQRQLEELRKASADVSTADKVAVLVAMELPTIEVSALLHKLSAQLAKDPEAVYFSKVNQSDNCGCGCGCGCAAMMGLPYEERLLAHFSTKPYSIDPFNELGTSEKERDGLQIDEFLASYEALSTSVGQRVNQRYFQVRRDFSV
jgi:hypothetical protein